MGWRGHIDCNIQFRSQTLQSRDMIGMLVRDEDGRELVSALPKLAKPFDCLAARESCVHEEARCAAGDDSAISATAAGQHRDRHCHKGSLPLTTVETRVSFRLSRYLWRGRPYECS